MSMQCSNLIAFVPFPRVILLRSRALSRLRAWRQAQAAFRTSPLNEIANLNRGFPVRASSASGGGPHRGERKGGRGPPACESRSGFVPTHVHLQRASLQTLRITGPLATLASPVYQPTAEPEKTRRRDRTRLTGPAPAPGAGPTRGRASPSRRRGAAPAGRGGKASGCAA